MTGRVIGIGIVETGVERELMMCNMDDDCPTFDITNEIKVVDDDYSVEDFPEGTYDSDDREKNSFRSSFSISSAEDVDLQVEDEEKDTDSNIDDTFVPAIEKLSIPKIDSLPQTSEREETPDISNIESCDVQRLRFSTLTVREYPRVLGDNVCMMGAPISLSWKHQDEVVYDIEDYEEAVQHTRRTQAELKMPSSHRNSLLREIGYSARDIQEAVKKSNIARNQRKRTVEMLKMQRVHEAFEKVGRVGRKLSLSKKKDQHTKMSGRKKI
mmetsp:Transcript_9021/g.21959  ORF Transcript_9021/g.21959 Transcript_9021/m.21959 type:complete len:269 (+) Transcript_9021:154-960(+)